MAELTRIREVPCKKDETTGQKKGGARHALERFRVKDTRRQQTLKLGIGIRAHQNQTLMIERLRVKGKRRAI